MAGLMQTIIVLIYSILVSTVNADIEQPLPDTDYSTDLQYDIGTQIIRFIIATDWPEIQEVQLNYNVSRLGRESEHSLTQDAKDGEDGTWTFTITDADIQAADIIFSQVKLNLASVTYVSAISTQLLLGRPRLRRQGQDSPPPRRQDGPPTRRPRPGSGGLSRPGGPGSGRTRPRIESPFGALNTNTTTQSWADRFTNSPEKLEFISSCIDNGDPIDQCQRMWEQGVGEEGLVPEATTTPINSEKASTATVTATTELETRTTTPERQPYRPTKLPPPRPDPSNEKEDNEYEEQKLSQTTIIIIATVVPFIVMSGLVVFACIIIRRRNPHSGHNSVSNGSYHDTVLKEAQLPRPPPVTHERMKRDPTLDDGGYYDMYEDVKGGHENPTPSLPQPRRLSTFDRNITETNLSEPNRPLPVTPAEQESSVYNDSGRTGYTLSGSHEEYAQGRPDSDYQRTRLTNDRTKLGTSPGNGFEVNQYEPRGLGGFPQGTMKDGYTVGGPNEDEDTYQDIGAYERPLPQRPDEAANYEKLKLQRRESHISLY